MSGNEAIAEGAIASGLGGYFGYPITPSSSIMEHVVKRSKKLEDTLNEEAADGWQMVFMVLEQKRYMLFWTREAAIVTLGRE